MSKPDDDEEQPGDGDTDEEFSDEEWEAADQVACDEMNRQ